MPELVLWTGAKVPVIKKYIQPLVTSFECKARVQPYTGPVVPELNEGDVCMASGQKTIDVLQKAGLVPKNRKVGSLRGTPIKLDNGATILPTFDPTLIELDYPRKSDIEWDLRLGERVLRTGGTAPEVGTYEWVDDYSYAIKKIEEKYKETGAPVPVSIDLETVGLDPWADDVFIVSISLTYEVGMAHLIRFKAPDDPKQPAMWMTPTEPDINKQVHKVINEGLLKQLKFIHSSPKVSIVGANYKFDMTWMSCHWGIDDFSAYRVDTTLLGSAIDENRSNSLETHAKIYTTMGGYDEHLNKTYDKGRMDLVPDDDLLVYAGGDTDACYRVREKEKIELSRQGEGPARFYVNLIHPAVKAFQVLERRGIYVDRNRYLELRDRVSTEMDEKHSNIINLFPRRLQLKYRDNLSLGRAAILSDFLFTPRGLNLKPLMVTEKSGAPSTAMEHFEMLVHEHQGHEELELFVNEMREYNSAKKTLTTYIDGFMAHIRSDGKFHPSFMLHRGSYGGGDAGTVTGRLSAKDPAVQTLPKHTKWAKPLRSVYVPPPGYVILDVDYSQGELKVVACVAQEQNMLAAYKGGLDLHSVTAAKLVGMEFEEFMAQPEAWRKEKRAGGKAGNFGLLYGMSAAGFQEYARKTYGVYLTIQEAEKFRDAFLFELYPGLSEWHERTKMLAAKHGKVISPLGRVRHLPLINSRDGSVRAKQERQAINSPIQSTLSDLGLLSASELHQAYPDLYCFNFTHDSLSFYVPEDSWKEWAIRIKGVMENLPLKDKFGWSPQLDFTVDAEMGIDSLASCEEVDLAS